MKIWMEKKFELVNGSNQTTIVFDNDIDLFKEHKLDSVLSVGKHITIFNFQLQI